jgi:hypothetical protein
LILRTSGMSPFWAVQRHYFNTLQSPSIAAELDLRAANQPTAEERTLRCVTGYLDISSTHSNRLNKDLYGDRSVFIDYFGPCEVEDHRLLINNY